jgi:hypothetical protein
MKLPLCLVALAACGSDLQRHTHAFVASASCAQGPFEVVLHADGKTGADGVEVVACTPRRLAGHVELDVGDFALHSGRFGDASDNARCVAGGAPVVTSAGGGAAGGATGTGGTRGDAPALVERPYTGGESPFADEVCKHLGLEAQQILIPTTLELADPGAILKVKLWSDTPNDLDHVVFLVRQLTSTKSRAEVAKEEDKRDRSHEAPVTREPVPDHGAPPAPLAEQRPVAPVATATWIPGYWTWTGSAWGWVAGFWRDERIAMPAPQVEVPGAPPAAAAVWIAGAWQLRAGTWVWVRGRWR